MDVWCRWSLVVGVCVCVCVLNWQGGSKVHKVPLPFVAFPVCVCVCVCVCDQSEETLNFYRTCLTLTYMSCANGVVLLIYLFWLSSKFLPWNVFPFEILLQQGDGEDI